MGKEITSFEILSKFGEHPQLSEINKSTVNPTYLYGLSGSSFSLVAFQIYLNAATDVLFVLNDRESAAYAYNEAQEFLGDSNCEFLISGYKKSAVFGQVDNESALLRSETIRNITTSNRKPLFIVSYPEAIIEKAPAPENIKSNTITLLKGEELSIPFLEDLFKTYHFQQVDFVFEPGQYAIRGSIVDVFSFSNTKPYRIDFLGDSVESIRTFDIESQLSDQFFDSVTIIPNISIDSRLGTQVPLSQILNKNSLLLFDDLKYVTDRLLAIHRMASEKVENDNSLLQKICDGEMLIQELLELKTYVRTTNPDKATVHFDTSSQPAFAKNFDYLIENLTDFAEKGYRLIFVSEQTRQLERINSILTQKHFAYRVDFVSSCLHAGFIDHRLKLCVYTDHQFFDRYQKYKLKFGFTRRESFTIQELTVLKPGDYVVHIDHGVGQFGGLEKITVNGKVQEVVKLVYKDKDILFVNIHSLHKISKYKGKDSTPPKIHKLGSAVWQNTKSSAKNKIKDIARELISLYAERLKQHGHAFSADTYLNEQLEASFIYEDTPDQESATKAVKADMEKPIPMDRLICGDVGFGKTEIAVRAAFKAVCDNKQVAILVPTTILAFQHMKTFSERLKDFPVRVEYISRMRSSSEQKKILNDLKKGLIDIIIGTHRLTSNDVVFKDLGLLIIDEEQKFGVRTKE
ncbi:MAG TPA: CarD family transcriptional regulator, partial [Salinivirgaceae bacterium]|nr:CarD family transcriptional regulator [Salinivirgaceae bacterium]